MGLRIQTNIAGLNAHRNLQNTDARLSKTLQRLSSGFRINSAADDAAGLAVSEGLRADIKSYRVASRNASEAASLLQVAEGAMDQIGSMLVRLKELATQAASDNTSSSNRVKLNSEATQLKTEITRIAKVTDYAGTKLIDGSFGSLSNVESADLATITAIEGVYEFNVDTASAGNYSISYASATNVMTVQKGAVSETQVISEGTTISFSTFGISFKTTPGSTADTVGDAIGDAFSNGSFVVETSAVNKTFQIGAGNTPDNRVSFSISDAQSTAIGLGTNSFIDDLSLTSSAGAQLGIDIINDAIDDIARIRGQVGAIQNRLGYAAANLATTIENVSAADSIIRDTDMAAEMVEFTKNQILLQAGTAMLAQANAAPQSILSLLQ